MNTKHTFIHPLFKMSQDFNRLWDLIQDGNRIPAWIVFSDEHENVIWDLVEVKARPNKEYMIGTRGISYEHKQDKQGFLFACMCLSLHFLHNV